MNPLTTALALAQGLWVRNRIEVLPVAGGPTSGRTDGHPGIEALRLGVLGESTAAGCGVESHDIGFAGALATRLSTGGRPVEWRVVGEHGATATRIRYRLMPRLEGEFDLVIVLAGANDVLSRRSPAAWGEDLTAIVSDLSARSKEVVVTGTPPFLAFPALPRTLARYLEGRADGLDQVSRAVCGRTSNAAFLTGTADLVDDGFFARDGFHPGVHGYRRWAEFVAEVHLG